MFLGIDNVGSGAYFVSNSSSDSLYHYLAFHHLVEIFEEEALSFSRPRDWDDPYDSKLKGNIAKSMYAQCWSRLQMSDAMWRIYSPNHFSVRIKTSDELLKAQVRNGLSQYSKGAQTEMKMGIVDYKSSKEVKEEVRRLDQRGEQMTIREAIDSLFIKRSAFKHEEEIRVAVFYRSKHEDRRPPRRLSIHIDPHALIRSVFIDPRAADELVNTFKYYLERKLKFKGTIRKSELYTRDDQD
jgi:hypothetical protein